MFRQTTLFMVTLAWSLGSCAGQTNSPNGIGGGDATTSPDLGIPADASPRDAAPSDCPELHGPASIVDTLVIGDTASAFDLDGDGNPDNRFGDARDAFNLLLGPTLTSGAFRLILELRSLDDPTFRNDDELFVAGYSAIDLDSPANPDDDFSGAEPFWHDPDDFLVDECEPASRLTASLHDGEIIGAAELLALPFGELGALPLLRAQFRAEITPSGGGFRITQSRLGGVVTACSLNRMEPLVDSNPLWLVAHSFDLQPDIDLDGDGLETINTSPFGVESCVDPGGLGNPIEGEDCGCAEGIADGYSVLITMTGVSATLLGPAPSQPLRD